MMLTAFVSQLCLIVGILWCVNGQETNFYDTETFATTNNVSHRSNFCPLHNLAETGKVSLRDALKGEKISVGLFQYQLDEDGGEGSGVYRINEINPGAGIKFLDELAVRAGFTWRDSFGILDSPSAYNETWDNLLRWSVDTYDLTGDWFVQSIDRLSEGIVFPEGWYDGSLIMVRKKPENDEYTSIWGFLLPFTYDLWGMILITTIASGLVLYMMDFTNAGGNKDKMELNLFESLYVSFIGFVGHLIHLPEKLGSRILIFSISFLFLLIMAAYTANLTSFLVISNTPTIVITDITDAIKNDLSFCVLQSSTSEKTLRTEYKAARIVQKDSIGDTYVAVSEGECDIVLTTVGTWKKNERNVKYNKGCNLEWVGRIVKPLEAGFSLRDSSTRCSSMLRDVLSLHMVEMKQERVYDAIWDKIINEKATINCLAEDSKENNYRLTMSNLGGIFILHIAVTTIAAAITFVNWFRERKSKETANSNLPTSSTTNTNNASSAETTSSIDSLRPNTTTNSVLLQQQNSNSTNTNSSKRASYRDSLRPEAPNNESEVSAPLQQTDAAAAQVDDSLVENSKADKTTMIVAVMAGALVMLWVSFFCLLYL